MQAIKDKIRTIPDFPKKGILFRDITTLLSDPEGLRLTIDAFVERYRGRGIEAVVGIEASDQRCCRLFKAAVERGDESFALLPVHD